VLSQFCEVVVADVQCLIVSTNSSNEVAPNTLSAGDIQLGIMDAKMDAAWIGVRSTVRISTVVLTLECRVYLRLSVCGQNTNASEIPVA
jgi:hypothetical protein